MLARRIEDGLEAGVLVGDQNMPVRAAVSTAASMPAELLHEADTAMYLAKGNEPATGQSRLGSSTDRRSDRAGSEGAGSQAQVPHTRRRTDRPGREA